MSTPQHPPHTQAKRRQQGASLLVVMVMLLLGSIIVLGSLRLTWLNEKLVGTQSDYQRTFAAAEALLRDAEQDIRGTKTDGTRCKAGAAYEGCRLFASAFFPKSSADVGVLEDRIPNARSTTAAPCREGICLPASTSSFTTATFSTELSSMTAVAARYGQYTDVTTTNPLLSNNNAWYWVEVFEYDKASPVTRPSGNLPIPDQSHPFVYRITAYVKGQKPNSRVLLRSLYIPKPQNRNR